MFQFTQPGVRANFGVLVGSLAFTACTVKMLMKVATSVGMTSDVIYLGGESLLFGKPLAAVMVTTNPV